jgi:EAL domain-containing protein (putative c-di-GMP-specific phosphodiesterase class I)
LYHAKEQGKNNYQFFSEEMNVEALLRSELEEDLRVAVERNEFIVYYQPRLDFRSGEITDVEALLRWNHPTKGLISPIHFISTAEETGLIVPIGEWVLRTACAQNKEWQKMGLPPICVAVNVSAKQLGQHLLSETVMEVLEEAELDPCFLELELTESVAMQDAETTIKIFTELKQKGIHISIDDFGTGYSSLSYLKRFPIDKLKIDKSFVNDVAEDPDDEAIVKAIIAVAHSLKLRVVAEGVETKEQLKFLRLQNCDEWQGYYFSQPVPAEQITQMLEERRTVDRVVA